MSILTYIPTIDRIITKYEGGYGWNKKDPGGPTKYGITFYDLAEHLGTPIKGVASEAVMAQWAPKVEAMTRATAETIYQTKYANSIRYNDLPAGPDAVILDYLINSGVHAIAAARAVVKVPGKNVMDQTLLDAIKKADPVVFVNAMCDVRMAFLKGLGTWSEFGNGWTARVADLRIYCTHLAQGGAAAAAPVAVDLTKVTTPKGVHVAKTAGTPTVIAAASTGAALHTAGFPWSVVIAGAVACVVIGVIYEAISSNSAASANVSVVIPPGTVLPTVPAAA